MDRAMSDFLSEYWLQYIAFEIPGATDASVAEWRFSGEGHHRGKYSIAHFPAHVFISIFTSDKRPSMEAKVRKPHSGKGLIEFVYGFLYVLLLIVGDKRYNVEARSIVGNRKIAGLVNEYAQSRAFVHPYKARAAGYPPLKAKNFLRVSVTPAFRPSSPSIVSNSFAGHKGVKSANSKSGRGWFVVSRRAGEEFSGIVARLEIVLKDRRKRGNRPCTHLCAM